MDWWMIALLGVAAVAGNVILVLALKKGRQNEAALQALAQSKGWRYEKVASTASVHGYLELSDIQAGWALRIYTGSREGGSSFSKWTDPRVGIPSGLAVYAAPLPEKTQAMMNVMIDKAGGLGRMLLDSVFKGLGPDARDLRTVDDDDPATLMATPGAEAAFDPLKGAAELGALNQFGKNIADVPFLVRSPEGLSMRINKRLTSPDEIASFVEVAETLCAKLRS